MEETKKEADQVNDQPQIVDGGMLPPMYLRPVTIDGVYYPSIQEILKKIGLVKSSSDIL